MLLLRGGETHLHGPRRYGHNRRQSLIDDIRFISHDRGARSAPRGTREHQVIGHAFLYGRLEAAVGLAQIRAVPEQNNRRVILADKLSDRLRSIEGVTPPFVPAETSHVYWLYHFRIDLDRFDVGVGEFIDALNAEGLRCGPAMYYLIPYSHTFIADRRQCSTGCRMPASTWRARSGGHGPEKYSDGDIDDIATVIAKVAKAYRK